MIGTTELVIAACLLGAGTFAFRAAGPVLGTRTTLGPRVREVMTVGATVLLVALVATSAFADGDQFADAARPIAVGVAGVLAWWRAPFVVVVLAAAGTAALLRLAGL